MPSSVVPTSTILVVEDDRVAREALVLLLEYEGYEVRSASGGDEALRVISGWTPDVVVSDVNMPGGDGFELIPALRRRSDCEDTAILLVSAIDDTARKVTGLDLGADDFLSKPVDPEELLARIRSHVRSSERRKHLRKASVTEANTGLLNRRGTQEALEEELHRARRGAQFSVVLVDLDRFKEINDQFGHQVGDMVLRQVAQSLENSGRSVDRVGRWGGDEFVVILNDCREEDIPVTVSRLRRHLEQTVRTEEGDEVRILCSLGGAAYRPGVTVNDMLKEADAAMYIDKEERHRAQTS